MADEYRDHVSHSKFVPPKSVLSYTARSYAFIAANEPGLPKPAFVLLQLETTTGKKVAFQLNSVQEVNQMMLNLALVARRVWEDIPPAGPEECDE